MRTLLIVLICALTASPRVCVAGARVGASDQRMSAGVHVGSPTDLDAELDAEQLDAWPESSVGKHLVLRAWWAGYALGRLK